MALQFLRIKLDFVQVSPDRAPRHKPGREVSSASIFTTFLINTFPRT